MRILLLEDEPKVSALVKRGLIAERYAVDVIADGREGLEYAEAYSYDLILLDLMLHGMSGVEVLQRVRRNNQFVPVLVLTARDSVDDKVKLFECGADDYLTKPFAFAELIVRVKALLRRGPVNRSSTLRIGDLELDRLTQQVKRHGKRIELTAKEYSLLEYLARRAGDVVSRADISEHVWDEHHDPLSNVVDVYVQRLRRKLDRAGSESIIRTRRGEGYQLAAGLEP